MTKVIILGSKEDPKHQPKKIQLLRSMGSSGTLANPGNIEASGWKNIELICRQYRAGTYDLIFAYDDNRDNGVFYLGHFNDGIV